VDGWDKNVLLWEKRDGQRPRGAAPICREPIRKLGGGQPEIL